MDVGAGIDAGGERSPRTGRGCHLHEAGAARATAWVGGALAGLLAAAAIAAPVTGQHDRFSFHIEVNRIVLEARAVDLGGHPILNLGRNDFRVLVDDDPVALESVVWVADDVPGAPESAPDQAPTAGSQPTPSGRLIVMFFQNDRHPSRMSGLLSMAPRAARMLDTLRSTDRVAVLSFDSHLKLHLDFTSDVEKLRRALVATSLLGEPPPPEPGPFPSIASTFDRAAARRAATPEKALQVTAEALRALPGRKSLVLFGWGLGYFSYPVVRPHRDYLAARRALAAARVTVFSLDITDADYHSLEAGLEQVAEDTGGFYAKTHLFPDIAMARLEEALAGHYELTFEKPPRPRGRHSVEVRLVGHNGRVHTRNGYED